MDALEQEYRDNLTRTAAREARRRLLFRRALLASNVLAVALTANRTSALEACVFLALLACLELVDYRAMKRRLPAPAVSRGGVGYRECPKAVDPSPSRYDDVLLVVRMALQVAAMAFIWGFGVVASVGAFAVLIVGTQRVYGAWRARRNARLALEWERRLGT